VATAGDRIRERRFALGLSTRAIASPGISASHITRIENGQRTPTAQALELLAAKLQVSPHWLATGKPDPAEKLAELVLAEPNQLPPQAATLARAILRSRPHNNPTR
jgi:transcriptional regulator with XRE-family HTH domain